MSDASDAPCDRLWTVRDVAAFLAVSPSWVYQASAGGTLPCVRLGAALRFDPDGIRAWVRGERHGGKVVQLPGCRGSVARSAGG
jgi:predicted DNA-binding transcriptional regulator AlpA